MKHAQGGMSRSRPKSIRPVALRSAHDHDRTWLIFVRDGVPMRKHSDPGAPLDGGLLFPPLIGGKFSNMRLPSWMRVSHLAARTMAPWFSSSSLDR